MAQPILQVSGLRTVLHLPTEIVPVVDNVEFSVDRGETLGIVGESGCGKSMLALSLIGLQPNPPAEIVAGSAEFEGADLLKMSNKNLREIRGRRIGMIFQEPMSALNPVMRIGDQVAEVVRRHFGMGMRAAWQRAIELLDLVKVSDPARRAREYPYQLSGGLRQRIMIAAALACEPAMLIADEPTTALDVTIQAQILDLIRELQENSGMAVILITHDLGVIAETADRVLVMYAGRVVEEANSTALFARPRHPYTAGLLHSVPVLGSNRDERLTEISGVVPPIDSLPPGCSFSPRCSRCLDHCSIEVPVLAASSAGGRVACLNPLGAA